MLSNVTGWIKKLTEAGVGLVALAVVVQVIFGSSASFLPGDVVARLNRYDWHTWWCWLSWFNYSRIVVPNLF